MTALVTEGVVLEIGQGDAASVAHGTDTYDAIGEVIDFDGPSGSAAVIDATSLASTAKEKLMGLPDEGQVSFNVHMDPGDAGQTALRTARSSKTLKNMTIRLTDGSNTELQFAAYVTGFAVSGAIEDTIKASVTVEITGAVTYA